MKGKEFVDSKWCKEAAKPQTQEKIKQSFNKWTNRVSNTGLLSRAKQLYQFFLSSEITGTQKILVAGALLYIISPLDIIPDFIPVVGWLDDLGIAGFALSYVFSQMDSLEQQKFIEQNKEISTVNKTADDLLNEDISGTKETGFCVDQDAPHSDFSLNTSSTTPLLTKKVQELAEIAATLHIQDAEKICSRLEETICEHNIPKIAVVGRYSTGKSTLINALLGKEILPSSPVPTTKAITYLMRGSEASLYSEMKNGEIVIHQSVDDLRNLYDKDIKKAQKITVTLPDFPLHNITIVDTPGLEDPDKSVTQLTLDILPDMDAIVVLLDANYMESKIEFEFVSSLLQNDKNRKLFIVINKIDGKPEEDRQKLEKLCQSHLIAYNIPNARIFSLSAIDGKSNPGVITFKKALFDFLENGIQKEVLRHAESEMNAYSKTLLAACDNAVEASHMDRQQSFENQKAAEEKIRKISQEYETQKKKLCRSFAGYRAQFFLDFSTFFENLKANIRQQILNSNLETLRNTDDIAAKIKQQIVAFVDEKLSEIDKNLQADFATSNQQIKGVLAELNLPINVEVKDYSKYADLFIPIVVASSYFFLGFFSFIWVVIGAIVGRNFFETAISRFLSTVGINGVREKITEEIFRNLDKGKKELENKLNGAFDTMEEELNNSFDAAMNNAITPLMFVTSKSEYDLNEITKCREKLLTFNK